MSLPRSGIVALCGLLGLLGFIFAQLGFAADPPATDARLKKLYGGAGGIKVIASVEKASAYRVAMRITKEEKGADIDGYRMLSGPVEVDAKSLASLRTAVLNPGTFDWDIATACEFQPGVLVRFEGTGNDGKASQVDLVFCFVCGELETWRDGTRGGLKFFGDHREPLVAVMKQIFPKDDEIQKLGKSE